MIRPRRVFDTFHRRGLFIRIPIGKLGILFPVSILRLKAAGSDLYERDVLGKLRQETIMQEIMRLSGGKDAAILCFERDPAQCHRSLVARWLRKAGYEITEYGA